MFASRPHIFIVTILLAAALAACQQPYGEGEPPDAALDLPAETLATSPARVDSLRDEVAQLSAALSRLQVTDSQRPDTSAEQALRAAADELQWIGFRVFWTLIVLIATFLAVRFGVSLIDYLAERSATRRLLFKRLIPIVRVVLWAIAVYYVIAVVFEIDRRGLLAAAAAIGVAVGFAAQDVLKNIFGGIILIFDQPFQVGDKVSVGGTYGEVVSIGLRSTRIVTPDDNLVTVPNSQAADSQVANANAGALTCQVVVDLYLPGWIDVGRAKAIAYEAAVNSRYVFLDKPIKVLVKDEFKTTFLTHLKVKAYVMDTRFEADLASDITETAKAEFLKEGMLVAFTGVPPIHGVTGNGEEEIA